MAGAATVEKALDVLFHLHEAETSLGLSQIGRDLDLPKSSCHRLLASLVDRDVVERDEHGRYRPGLALLSLGFGAQAHEPVVRAARPVLESEAVSLGETVFLVARRRGKLRVLDKCEGSSFLRAAPDVGDVVPPEVTAAGRIYRVHRDAAQGGAAVTRDGPAEGARYGANDPGESTEDAHLLERGYATNRNAWIEGLSVLAVPIWQKRPAGRRELVAALALGAASPRFETLGEEVVAAHLIAAAEAIQIRLGSPPPNGKAAGRRPGKEIQR